MRYALIKNNVIDNIIECESYRDSQIMAQMLDMDEAINVDLYNVSAGYTYEDGQFKTPEGILVDKEKTLDEKLAELKLKNDLMQGALDEILLGGGL